MNHPSLHQFSRSTLKLEQEGIMKTIASAFIFAALAAAHSAVWTIEFDGTTYPARDARMDAQLGAKRVEWTYDNNKGPDGKPAPWQAVTNVLDEGITCKSRSVF
jgi:hypothetical protein